MNNGIIVAAAIGLAGILSADEFPKPYSPPCVERENVFSARGGSAFGGEFTIRSAGRAL